VVEGGFLQLFRVHLPQSLLALDREATAAGVEHPGNEVQRAPRGAGAVAASYVITTMGWQRILLVTKSWQRAVKWVRQRGARASDPCNIIAI
jgi:hypothetical protein